MHLYSKQNEAIQLKDIPIKLILNFSKTVISDAMKVAFKPSNICGETFKPSPNLHYMYRCVCFQLLYEHCI